MEQEVMLQKHPLLQLSTECRQKRAHCQLESTASSPPNLNELIVSAPLAISYVLHASEWSYLLPKKPPKTQQTKPLPKVKKPNQSKATFLFILLINQDGVLPPWNGSCDLLLNYFRSLLI